MKRVLLIVLCLGALGLSAVPAMASSPTNSAYSGPGASQLTQVQTQSPVTTTKASDSSLPFTGLNLAVVGLVAVVLAGSGLILRRRSAADRK
jgi:hypothetical protein